MIRYNKKFMRRAIQLAQQGMESGAGGPFGAVIVRDGKIIGEGHNCVIKDNDPTAHAEVVAIRNACANIKEYQLHDCVIYTSCEPCPMCLGAIYWARPKAIFYACTREDAADIGFDDEFLYGELVKPMPHREIPILPRLREEALPLFKQWADNPDKSLY